MDKFTFEKGVAVIFDSSPTEEDYEKVQKLIDTKTEKLYSHLGISKDVLQNHQKTATEIQQEMMHELYKRELDEMRKRNENNQTR